MKIKLVILLLLLCNCAFAQDTVYARKTLKKLTSPALWGRGYTKDGMGKAATFIEKEFSKMGLSAQRQEFEFPVNTFPGNMSLTINGKKLKPGHDFLVSQASKGLSASGVLAQEDSVNYSAERQSLRILIQPKLTWSVARRVEDFTEIIVKKGVLNQPPTQFKTDIENRFVPSFKAFNVMSSVKGTKYPDSMLVLTAHYDHLGGMGRSTYFPGANDNASGVSLILDLARYYARNPPAYTVVFICFAAEEAGLIGSKFFTENPMIKLSNIRFLFNLDLVGTGDAGATVVNATVHAKEFALLNKVNDEGKYLKKINSRGKAPNSDHYFFSEKGVPAFFLYTQGGISAYHDVDDKASTLPFTVYPKLFNLLVNFNKKLMAD
ncbi:MAG: M28 family peptidase [Pedobacter sp.]|nr:MAG: M28 family peptidase [Pedobacter sp.]